MNHLPGTTYPMTFEQESMWLQEQSIEGDSFLLESWVYRLRGPLDVPALEWALTELVRRQAVLRTRLILHDDDLVQVIAPEPELVLHRRACREDALDDELRRAVRVPLDLAEPPFRATLIELAVDHFVLAVEFHHTAVDDWSYLVLNHELGELYRGRVQRQAPDLPTLSNELGDFAAHQRAVGVDPAVLEWWREALAGAPEYDLLPLDRARPQQPRHSGVHLSFVFPVELARAVRRLGRATRTTPFTVYAAALAAQLHGYTGNPDVVFGVPVSRRGSAALDSVIGCLTDQMPMRHSVRAEASFADLVATTKEMITGAMARRDISYAALLRAIGRVPHDGESPLCQISLVLDDAPRVPLDLPGIEASRLHVDPGMSKFDMCLFLIREGDGLHAILEYADELFDRGTAERVAGDFVLLLTAAVTDPDRSVAELLSHSTARIGGDEGR